MRKLAGLICYGVGSKLEETFSDPYIYALSMLGFCSQSESSYFGMIYFMLMSTIF